MLNLPNSQLDDLSLDPIDELEPTPPESPPTHELHDLSTPESIKAAYYAIAAQVLKWTDYTGMDWDTLYKDIKGQFDLGKSLDAMVVKEAISSGHTDAFAMTLLAQSPYLQYHKNQGNLRPSDMFDYSQWILEQYYRSKN